MEVEVKLHSFLTFEPDIREWYAQRFGRFTCGKSSQYQLDRRLGGFQSRSEPDGEQNKSYSPHFKIVMASGSIKLSRLKHSL